MDRASTCPEDVEEMTEISVLVLGAVRELFSIHMNFKKLLKSLCLLVYLKDKFTLVR